MNQLDVPGIEKQRRESAPITERELSDFMEGTVGTMSSNLERADAMTGLPNLEDQKERKSRLKS